MCCVGLCDSALSHLPAGSWASGLQRCCSSDSDEEAFSHLQLTWASVSQGRAEWAVGNGEGPDAASTL